MSHRAPIYRGINAEKKWIMEHGGQSECRVGKESVPAVFIPCCLSFRARAASRGISLQLRPCQIREFGRLFVLINAKVDM